MTQRNRAAVNVEFLHGQGMPILREAFYVGQHLRGKGFVRLDEVEVVDLRAGLFQRLA